VAGQGFQPETIHDMSVALERVCAALGLTLHDDPATRLVATKIVETAERGITDSDTIAKLVLKEFEQRK
jgi:hypothetical protein